MEVVIAVISSPDSSELSSPGGVDGGGGGGGEGEGEGDGLLLRGGGGADGANDGSLPRCCWVFSSLQAAIASSSASSSLLNRSQDICDKSVRIY